MAVSRGHISPCGLQWSVLSVTLCMVFTLWFRPVSAQTCTTVSGAEVTCEQGGKITVTTSCPPKYIIKMMSVTYLVSDETACPDANPEPPTSHCVVSTDPGNLNRECDRQKTCTVEIPKNTGGSCSGTGIHYIRLVHYCEPLHYHNDDRAGVTSIDLTTALSGVQLVYVTSNIKALTGNDATFKDTSLGCILTVPSDTQVAFQVLVKKTDPQQYGCNQRIQLWDGVKYERSLCSASTSVLTMGGCDVSGDTLYIRYRNTDPNVRIGFVFSVGVSHLSAGFDMQCGLDVTKFPAVVVPTTTTATGVNPEGRAVGKADAPDDQSLKLIIILVSVAVFLVVLVIIIGILIRKFSRKPTILEGSEVDDMHDSKPTYVRDVYLDGQSRSQLVMEKRRSLAPIDGSISIRI